MARDVELEALEREAYRATTSDGIIDLYVGLALLWIGAAWIWWDALAGIAGVLPAILVAPMLAARKRFLEARLGYVRWRSPRRRRGQRYLGLLLLVGLALFAGAVVVFLVADRSNAASEGLRIAPGIMAWLLALIAVGLALLLATRRLLLYAATLAVTGIFVVWAEAEPGWPMLVTGAVASVIGVFMLLRFVQRHPLIAGA